MTRLETILDLKRQLALLGNYDSAIAGPIGEIYAEEVLGMIKADRGAAGYDGFIKGRRVQIKAKEHDRRPRSQSYVAIGTGKELLADDLLVVIISDEKCEHIGPVPIETIKFTQRPTQRRYSLLYVKAAEELFNRQLEGAILGAAG